MEQARSLIEPLPDRYRSALAGTPEHVLRRRPSPEVWSAVEYLCHVRDVFVSHLIRLYRARTEDDPALEPMFNDLRARRLRYREREVSATLDELEAAVPGLLEEAARFRPRDWARTVHRQPGERRTARWLLRNAAHEGVHHLGDLPGHREGGNVGAHCWESDANRGEMKSLCSGKTCHRGHH